VDAQPEAEMFLHLGDGENEVDDLRALYPQKQIVFVRGNCDLGSIAKGEDLITACGKRIFFTHGHTYDVKSGLAKLTNRAIDLKADIVCFGHTHSPLSARADSIYLLNPGSAGSPRPGAPPTCATIDIDRKGIAINIIEL